MNRWFKTSNLLQTLFNSCTCVIHVHVHVYTHIYTCTCTCIIQVHELNYVYVCVDMYMYMQIHIYMYMYMVYVHRLCINGIVCTYTVHEYASNVYMCISFIMLQEQGITPNRGTLTLLLEAYCQQGNIDGAREVHTCTCTCTCTCTVHVYQLLIVQFQLNLLQ